MSDVARIDLMSYLRGERHRLADDGTSCHLRDLGDVIVFYDGESDELSVWRRITQTLNIPARDLFAPVTD